MLVCFLQWHKIDYVSNKYKSQLTVNLIQKSAHRSELVQRRVPGLRPVAKKTGKPIQILESKFKDSEAIRKTGKSTQRQESQFKDW